MQLGAVVRKISLIVWIHCRKRRLHVQLQQQLVQLDRLRVFPGGSAQGLRASPQDFLSTAHASVRLVT